MDFQYIEITDDNDNIFRLTYENDVLSISDKTKNNTIDIKLQDTKGLINAIKYMALYSAVRK